MKEPNNPSFVYHQKLVNIRSSINYKESPDKSNLYSIAVALKQTYAEFLAHGSQKTAICEFNDYRKSRLESLKLSLEKYYQFLGHENYTKTKLEIYKVLAESLGAQLSEDGLELVENKLQPGEVSTEWLVNCYLYIDSLPFN